MSKKFVKQTQLFFSLLFALVIIIFNLCFLFVSIRDFIFSYNEIHNIDFSSTIATVSITLLGFLITFLAIILTLPKSLFTKDYKRLGNLDILIHSYKCTLISLFFTFIFAIFHVFNPSSISWWFVLNSFLISLVYIAVVLIASFNFVSNVIKNKF